jgi:hypothetical protein
MTTTPGTNPPGFFFVASMAVMVAIAVAMSSSSPRTMGLPTFTRPPSVARASRFRSSRTWVGLSTRRMRLVRKSGAVSRNASDFVRRIRSGPRMIIGSFRVNFMPSSSAVSSNDCTSQAPA